MNKIDIGKRVRQLRTDMYLNQDEVARQLGITRANLSKLEIGHIAPTARILIQLKKIFACSIDWILTGSGSQKSP